MIGQNGSRFIPTDKIRNLRDFGGYPLRAGGSLVTGQLFRCGDSSEATDSDLALIDRMGPVLLADLRGTSEREKAPCRWPAGLDARIVEPQGESARMAFHEEVVTQVKDAATIREEFATRYADLPFRPHLQQVYSDYLNELATADGPSFVFCTAGKDRTGFIVAVLQLLLGVHLDDVIAEYLLTNAAPDGKEQVDRLRSQIEHRFGKGLSEEAIQVVTRVEPVFLTRALDAVEEKYGSVERYAHAALGCSPQTVERLRARLTA